MLRTLWLVAGCARRLHSGFGPLSDSLASFGRLSGGTAAGRSAHTRCLGDPSGRRGHVSVVAEAPPPPRRLAARRARQLGFIPNACMSSVALSLTACPLVTAAA